MCSEPSPLNCHRATLLAPAFQARQIDVVHLLHNGTALTELPAPAAPFPAGALPPHRITRDTAVDRDLRRLFALSGDVETLRSDLDAAQLTLEEAAGTLLRSGTTTPADISTASGISPDRLHRLTGHNEPRNKP